MRAHTNSRLLLALAVSVISAALAGCGMTAPGVSGSGGSGTGAAHITGIVHGGQQPVRGASILLYAVGNTGRRSAATPLLTQAVTTDSRGEFRLDGLWSCADTATYGSDPLLYIVSFGGNPGLADGTNNQAIVLMAAIGRCSTLTVQSTLFIDEVSTVAAAYALAPYMSDAKHIGEDAARMNGLANAFATIPTLASLSGGFTPGPGIQPGESVPIEEINSLADVIATCVNSDGTTACGPLFTAASDGNGGPAPQDTLAAVLAIARNPSRHVQAIQNLVSPTAPFQPSLSSAPPDWTMMLKFTGNGLASPVGIALDAAGNAWIANAGGAGITGLTSQGVPLTGSSGFTANGSIYGAQGIAVAPGGSVWVADTLLSQVFRLDVANGAIVAATGFSGTLNGPVSIAVDHQSNVWLANFADDTVTKLDPSGVPAANTPWSASGTISAPSAIALDRFGNAWIANSGGSTVARLDSGGAVLSGTGYTDGVVLAPTAIALDAQSHAWVADAGDSALSVFTQDGSSAAGSPFTGAGLSMPSAIALDGDGNAWAANATSPGSLALVRAGASSPADALGVLSAPAGIAVDSSGNVWTTNSGDDSVSKFVGIATPVVTPLSAVAGP